MHLTVCGCFPFYNQNITMSKYRDNILIEAYNKFRTEKCVRLQKSSPKNVQELLGHSDVSTTMSIYARSTRKAKRDSTRLLDKVASNA